jgi:hypothetical protein
MSSIEGIPELFPGDYRLRDELDDLMEQIESSNEERTSSLPQPIDWSTFWNRGSRTGIFIVPFIVPIGRQVAIYSKAKQGKSLLSLEIAASVATGTNILGQRNELGPMPVVYLDMEMTEDDVEERLTDFGMDCSTNLTNLKYFSLPNLPPLSSPQGARDLEKLVKLHEAKLLIVDTVGRVVEGDENSSESIRAFYRNSGVMLKKLGVSVIRLDHEGKDASNGARGSSAKSDDVDAVWRLSKSGGVSTLKCQFARINWLPSSVRLEMTSGGGLPMHQLILDVSDATAHAINDLLDEKGAERDISISRAQEILALSGGSRRKADVAAALRLRKERA